MKKLLIFGLVFLLAISIVNAATATFSRNLPSSATAGNTFDVTYSTADASGNWGVLIEDDITSGGCIFTGTGDTHLATGWIGPATSLTIQVTANSPDCTFSGNSAYAADQSYPEETLLGDSTVTISGDCIEDCGSRTCGVDPVCGTLSCGTCIGDDVCTGGSCVAPECTIDSDCASGETCSSGTCVSPEKCEFWEKKKEGVCEINTGMLVLIGIGLFALRLLSS